MNTIKRIKGVVIFQDGLYLSAEHHASFKIPVSHKELQSFFGRVNFYGEMIPKFATKNLPLNDLQSQDFEEADHHNLCFLTIKQELCSKPVVRNYFLDKEVTVTDSSEKAAGGLLSQERHPVIYVSRKLSSTERN